MRNLNMKSCIMKSGEFAYQIAQEIGWHPTKISQIVSGVYSPAKEEEELLANAIGITVAELFPKPENLVAT